MMKTKKQIQSEGKQDEGKQSESKHSAGKERSADQSKGHPAGRTAQERRYTARCAVLGTVTAAGLAACLVFRDEWGTALFFPLLGAAITALLWCVLVRLCLCRDPAHLLLRDFTRALRRALEIPVWAGVTALLCLLPVEIPFSVSILLVLLLLAAVPAAALMGVLSVCSAVRHLRAASGAEPAIYREGPLVLAVLLLVAELAVLGWLAIYLLL